MSSPHEMTRTETPDPGVEQWTCGTCSRQLLLRRPPAFELIVLEPGDEKAAHVGSTGGLRVAAAEATSTSSTDPTAHDSAWLAELGIDWGPGGAGQPGDPAQPG